jgi:nucleoside-diphosphate kinase
VAALTESCSGWLHDVICDSAVFHGGYDRKATRAVGTGRVQGAADAALPFRPQTLTQPPEAEPEEAAMATERTFSIIKPDATRRNLTGKVNAVIEAAGLRIVAQKRLHMTQAQAEAFYGVHAARPFFRDLVTFMISGPVVVQVLEGDNAVARYRDVMGATNPANAAEGTLRKLFAESIEANSAHGSDSPENAAVEIAYFFAGTEIVG